MGDKKRVLIIDDLQDILDEAECGLNKYGSAKYHVKTFQYDLSESYLKGHAQDGSYRSPTWDSIDSKLKYLILAFDPDFILMDWGYFITGIEGDNDSLRYTWNIEAAKVLNRDARHLLSKDGIVGQHLSRKDRSACPDVLVYTFNPFENNVFEELADVQDDFVARYATGVSGTDRRPSLHYIETSVFFNRPKGLALYRGYRDKGAARQLIGSKEDLKDYGHLLAVIFHDYLEERTGGNLTHRPDKRIFDVESLRFVRYTRFVSDKLGVVSYGKKADQNKVQLKLGAVTYYAPDAKILLDVPRKGYYDALDGWAKSDKFAHLLFGTKEAWQRSGRDYLYLRLYVKPTEHIDQGNGKAPKITIARWYSSNGDYFKVNEIRLKQLSSLLFSSIFNYCAKNAENKWHPACDNIEILTYPSGNNSTGDALEQEGPHTVDVFFLSQELDAGPGEPGWINYTLYDDSPGHLLDKENVEEVVKRILFDIRPAIIAKAKDALLPQLLNENKQQAMRAAISRVMARSTSHNLGSHSLQELTDPRVLAAALKDPEIAKQDLIAAFRYLKDRMEMQAQVATTTSGVVQTVSLTDISKLFGTAKLLIHNMVKFKCAPSLQVPPVVYIGVPEGPLGISALFNLLENVIRNANRHTQWEGGVFELRDDECYEHDELKRLQLTHKWVVNDPEEALKKIKKPLDDPMMDPHTDKLRNGGWGMLEMKLVCAYLRQLDLASVDDRAIDPPLLHVEQVEPEGVNPLRLRYTFYVCKPRDLIRISLGDNDLLEYKDSTGKVVRMDHANRFAIAVVNINAAVEPSRAAWPVRRISVPDPNAYTRELAWRAYMTGVLQKAEITVCLEFMDGDSKEAYIIAGGATTVSCMLYEHPGPEHYKSACAHPSGADSLRLLQALRSDKMTGSYRSAIVDDVKKGGVWAFRLAEAAITPIIVFDERIQKRMSGDEELKDQVKAMGVYVPDVKANADLYKEKISWPKCKAYLESLHGNFTRIGMTEIHLVIHRTVLFKLFTNAVEGVAALRAMGFIVYWTSGAAAADEFDASVPYVPFAILERSILEDQCKWQLVDTLKLL